MHRNIATILIVTVATLVLFSLGMAYLIDIKPVLSPQEHKYARFRHEKNEIIDKMPVVLSGLRSPLQTDTVEQHDGYPQEALSRLAPPGEPGQKNTTSSKTMEAVAGQGKDKEKTAHGLSMVFIKDKTRLAVIDGNIAKEGEMTRSGRIKMIRNDGVLIKDNEGEKWLRIE